MACFIGTEVPCPDRYAPSVIANSRFIELNSSFSNDANAYYFMSNTTLARGMAF